MNRTPYTDAHAAAVLHDHLQGYHRSTASPVCSRCAAASDHVFVVFDSDGNEVETIRPSADLARDIGLAVLRHYALVDSVPGADEPFLTITRSLPDD